jgi:hypothetical protein
MTNRQTKFLIKRSNVPGKVPPASGLTSGELALNTADAILYTSGSTANQILPIGWDRLSTLSGGTVSGGTIFQSGLTANTIYTDYIDFNTTPTVPSPTGGTLYFDSNENALSYKPITNQNDVTVNLGQESLIRIYNDLSTTILNGQVLHITGATSGVPTVALANASNLGAVFTESLAQSSGVATHNIPSGEYGFMTNFGIVRDLNTTAFTVGQEVFLSDTIDGGLTNDPNNIAFTSRISTVGYCLESNATTGKILVVITNENPLQSLTQQEVNVLLGNTISTGAYFYTGATTASTTTINVSPMRGWIVYNTGPIYATSPLVLNIYYSGGTNLPVSGLTSSFDTYLLVNSGGTLYQTNTYPTPQERRQNIFLGRVVHPNKTTILNVEQSVDYDVSPLSSLRDLWVPIKIINEGVVPSPNGATLTFKTSSGTFWGNGIGFPTDELNPNAITVPGYLPASFYYTTQTGGTFTATTTTVDTTKYDVNGVAVNVPGSGNYTTQRIYMSQSGVIRLQYGQSFYSTLAKAIAAIPSETFVVNPDNSIDCTLIGLLTVKDGTGDLSDTDDAIFTFVSKFGEILGGTAGISTTTLQQAYNNSVNPEITTNTTLGSVQFKSGTGSDTDKNISIENNSGIETAFIRADGYGKFTTLSATTIGASGNCVTDLYISNIHSCSPLNINPLDEGNVYFGSTSGVTVDVINSRLGIGTNSPSYPLQIVKTNKQVYYDDTAAGGNLLLSGSSEVPRISVNVSPYLSNPAVGIDVGMRAWDDVTYQTYGKVGDGFIRSSQDANGLNIINAPGSSSEDYIRFYAGQSASTGNTPDIHIQGSGLTRGNVGIGTSSPSQKLHISGNAGTVIYEGTNHVFQQYYPQGISGGRFGYIGYAASGSTDLRIQSEKPGGLLYLGTEGNITMTFSGSNVGVNIAPTAKFHINNTSSFNSFLVEDDTNPDSTPFVIDSIGRVGIGTTNPGEKVSIIDGSQFIWGSGNTNTGLRLQYGLGTSFWVNTPSGGTMSIGGIGTSAPSSGVINITSTGNVGIGIPTPTEKLHVAGNALITGTTFTGNLIVTGGTGINWISGSTSTDMLRITQTGNGNALVVEDSTNPDSSPFVINQLGNVGIGTPTPAVALQISGNANSVRYEGIDHVYQEYYPQGISAGRFGFIGYETSGSTNLNVFNQVSGGTLIFGTELNPRMYISSSGNVGIGNSNPTQRLQIAISGSSTIGGTSLSGSTLLVGTINNGIGIDNNELFNAGNEFIIGTLGSNSISFRPNSTPRMVISSSGDVGIGITSPTAKLHINNLNAGNSFLVEDSTNPDSTPFVIDSIGSVGIGTTTPSYLLDVKNEQILGILSGDTKVISKFSGRIGGTGGTNNNNFRIISTRLEDYSSNDWSRTGLRLEASIDDSDTANSWIEFRKPTFSSINNQIAFGESSGSSGQWMIIDNGNVGINTTTPSEKLQISGNTIVSGTISGGTMVITTQPTSGYTATQILMRNSTTGQVEITDSTSPSIYNYGMTYVMSTFNYLT